MRKNRPVDLDLDIDIGLEASTVRDVTRASAHNQQAAASDEKLRMLGEMTSGIVHDMKNLLAALDAGLLLAGKSAHRPDDLRMYIHASREVVQRGVILVSQLLTFVRHAEPSRTGPIDLNANLKALEPMLGYATGPAVCVTIDCADRLPPCLVDSVQFDVAILNLVVNARDAMPNGGEVRISTAARVMDDPLSGVAGQTCVRVRVADTGEGISSHLLPAIFDRSFTTKGPKGTGIGLPQVFRFAWLAGGFVTVSSESGVGTVFDLLLPAAAADRLGDGAGAEGEACSTDLR